MIARRSAQGVAYKRQRAEEWGKRCRATIQQAIAHPEAAPSGIDWHLDHVWRSAKVAASFALDIVGRER